MAFSNFSYLLRVEFWTQDQVFLYVQLLVVSSNI